MDALFHLLAGFSAVFTPMNFSLLFIGLVLGLLVAVLPGLTLVMGVVLALPFTYGLGVVPAIILLTAMYVSGTYGGAWTSILFKIPGEPMDVPLLWDGYAMAKAGKPALALGWTLVAALVGGLVAATAMVLISGPVAKFALLLSTPELFSILVLGLVTVACLGSGALPNAFISLALGLLIATVGTDTTYGVERYTFGVNILSDGIEYLSVMVGAYGLGEVITRLFKNQPPDRIQDNHGELRTEFPTFREIKEIKATFIRSSILGFVKGLVPGAGATIASFMSYAIEAQYGRRRGQLGKGLPEGIVAPQTAATASVGGAMVPLLTLGIPSSGATAVILGAFLLNGIQPGPHVFFKSGDIVYTIFASVFVSVIGMCIIGYFAIKMLVKVLDFPEGIVSAFVVMFCFIGALTARNNTTDLWVIVAFGVIGFLFEKYRFPIAPLVLGTILGPQAEANFMTTMISYNNDWTVFFTRPISGAVMVLSVLAIAFPILANRRARRTALLLREPIQAVQIHSAVKSTS